MNVSTLKEQKAIWIALAFGVIHATICLFLIPWANAAFQVWFDTGSPQSAAERFGYLVSHVLSFPIAFWSLWLHPAHISTQEFVTAVALNSLLWSLCLYFILIRFSRLAASNKAGTLMLLVVLLTMLNVNSVRAQQPAPTPTPTPANENKPSASDNLIQTNLHSAVLNEERRVIIHLPRNYSRDTAQKYPVMYVLDGTSQDQHTADKIAVLSDTGLIPSAIVIGLPNTRGNRERDQTPPFMRRDVNDQNSPYGAADKFLLFIEKELIPFVDRNYRTSGYKMLSGNSRGGLFVFYTFLEKPDLFQARFCYSTPVWRFDNLMVNKTAEFLRSSTGLSSFLYLSVGEKETEQMIGGFNKMVEVLNKTRKKTFRWIADYTPFAVHQDNAPISTSKGLAEWGKYLKEIKQ